MAKHSQRRDPEVRYYLSRARWLKARPSKGVRVIRVLRQSAESAGRTQSEAVPFARKCLADGIREFRRLRSTAYKTRTTEFAVALLETFGGDPESAIKLAELTDVDAFIKMNKKKPRGER